MAKKKLTFTFVDPNRPEDVERLLLRILVGKLRALQEEHMRHGRS